MSGHFSYYFFLCYADHRHLHSFPTRRSSDLAHADGWFIVFDTLTLADDRLEAFYDNPNASNRSDRKSGSAGMPRPISYAVFCLKKKNEEEELWRLRDYVSAGVDELLLLLV